MAGSMAIMSFAIALLFCVQTTFGGITCENLDKSICAFSVSSSGTRCILEKRMQKDGELQFYCCSSEIQAEKNLMNWLESDTCIEACGLHRNTVGISTDYLLDRNFTQKLCSPECYNDCPNIVDLYFNLAVGEGVYLPKLCEEQKVNAQKAMADIRSSGAAAVAEDDSSDATAVTDVSSSDAETATEVSSSDAETATEVSSSGEVQHVNINRHPHVTTVMPEKAGL